MSDVVMICPRCKTRKIITQDEFRSMIRLFCDGVLCKNVAMIYHKDHLPENIPPPKSAEELLALRNRTIWFTDDICHLCRMPIFTDGKTKWCKKGCGGNQPGTYSKFQEDYIR